MNVGLLFGSFNPVHQGHLMIASYMYNYHAFDEIWFVVSPINPLKNRYNIIDEDIRLHMLELAIVDDKKFKVLNIEFGLPRPSYTINTLKILSNSHKDYIFSIIMGYDNIVSLHKWKEYNSILTNYQIYVYPRVTTFSESPLLGHKSIILTKAPIIEISSSLIRDAIGNGKYLLYFMPEPVLSFIKEKALYRSK